MKEMLYLMTHLTHFYLLAYSFKWRFLEYMLETEIEELKEKKEDLKRMSILLF